MLEILKREIIGEEFEYITVRILNDDKVDRVILKRRPNWNNRVIDITIFFKSHRVATYSGNLSNHKMPPKYRKYITEIEKKLK